MNEDSYDPPVPADAASELPMPRISDRLTATSQATRSGRAARGNGWTPERIRTFLEALAECGVVDDAARAAGMSRQSAYNLRNRSKGRAFHLAWNAALQLARRRIADDVVSRAVHGCVEVIMRDGEVWGERHRFDNRLTMAVLTRLDQQFLARDDENLTARLVAEEFDEFLGIVCAGEEGDAAAFVETRREVDCGYVPSKEASLLDRLDRYHRHGAGLDPEAAEHDPEDEEE